MNEKFRPDFSKRPAATATAPLPPIAATAAATVTPAPATVSEAPPDMLGQLAARVAKLEAYIAVFNDWAEAAGVADTLLVRDGFGSKTHLAACVKRDALRAKFAETAR